MWRVGIDTGIGYKEAIKAHEMLILIIIINWNSTAAGLKDESLQINLAQPQIEFWS